MSASEPLVSRNLILAVASVFVTQTIGAIWWASSLSNDVGTIKEFMKQLRAETYTRAEAQLQFQRLDQSDQNIISGMGELKGRVSAVEGQTRRDDFTRYRSNAIRPDTQADVRAMKPQ